MKKTYMILASTILMMASQSFANIALTDISERDLEAIVQEFSSNFAHTTVTGANTEGSIFGFQVGLIGGLTNTTNLDKLVKEVDPSADTAYFPHGGLFGVVSVPMGFTLEALLIPGLNAAGADFSSTGMALKWTLTETIPLPVDIALRGHYTTTQLEYNQVIGGVPTDVEYSNTTMGLQAILGVNLRIIKPYIGVGTIQGDGEITVKGTQTIFDSSFTTSNKASKAVSDTQTLAGVEVSLLLIKLGLEYSSQFGADRYTFKLAAGF